MKYKIKNWHKFQHFKDRNPPWIKVYRDLLDDPDWHSLDPAAAKLLVMLWLVASQNGGSLPTADKLAFRLRLPTEELEPIIDRLRGWLDTYDIEPISTQYRADAPEAETETDKNTLTAHAHAHEETAPAAPSFRVPTVEEVVAGGALAGVPADYCRKWHATMTDQHWLDSNARPIHHRWRNVLKTWHENDRAKAGKAGGSKLAIGQVHHQDDPLEIDGRGGKR